MLLPVLGVTWVLGVFAVNSNTTVFAWLFTIFNSLQASDKIVNCWYFVNNISGSLLHVTDFASICMPIYPKTLHHFFTGILFALQGVFILIFHVLRSDKVTEVVIEL